MLKKHLIVLWKSLTHEGKSQDIFSHFSNVSTHTKSIFIKYLNKSNQPNLQTYRSYYNKVKQLPQHFIKTVF